MIDVLKFVKGAVAKKRLVPELKHFKIHKGRIQAYNGIIALCSDIDFDIDCMPEANSFVKAIEKCNDTASLTLTEANTLHVKSNNFQSYVKCLPESEQSDLFFTPSGEKFEIDGKKLITGLQNLFPFIGDDASRPWCRGILLKNYSMYATNNIIAVEYWVGMTFPITCNIPKEAIVEILRIKDVPDTVQIDHNSITFHYKNNKWIRSRLLNIDWPDIDKILIDTSDNAKSVNKELFIALEALKPFVENEGRIYINDGVFSTNLMKNQGAHYKIKNCNYSGVFHIKPLESLKNIAETIDFTTYPQPSPFFGKNIRGMIIGMKI